MERVKTECLAPLLAPAQGQQKACHFLYHLEPERGTQRENVNGSAQQE